MVDWGLAKPMGVRGETNGNETVAERTLRPVLSDSSTPTQTGTALGTPGYLPPEQAAGLLDELGPASDVYSLGATLYCLLTGTAPFEGSYVGEILQKVKAGDFLRPREVRRDVAAALEAVCLKAMALKPQDRYSSPRTLAADIERWLADEPVSAWSEPWPVRARRWLGRHRTLVTTTAATLLVATVSLAVATILLQTANSRERQANADKEAALEEKEIALHTAKASAEEANEASGRARTEADNAEAVLNELSEFLYTLVDPRQNRRKSLTGREVLDLAAKRIPKVFKDRLEIQGTLLETIGFSYDRLGLYREAEESFRKVLSIRRKVLGEEHSDTALSYRYLADILNAQSKYVEAMEACGKALTIHRKVLGDEDLGTAYSYSTLADIFSSQCKYAEAEETSRKVLSIRLKLLDEQHPNVARSYNNLALILNARNNYPQAEELYRKGLVITLRLVGESHPDTATMLNNLAQNMTDQGRFQEAEKVFQRALAIRRKVLGEEHPDVDQSYSALAKNLHDQGKYTVAEETYRKALAIARKVSGDEHPDTISTYKNLASNLYAQGKYKEAETLLLTASASFDKALLRVSAKGLERAAFTSRYSPLPLLSALLARNGKPDDAWQRFEESLARGTWHDLKGRSPIVDERLAERKRVQTLLPSDVAFLAWLDIKGEPKAVDPNGEHWAILLRSSGDPIWVRLSGTGAKNAWTDADTQLPVRLREALQSPRGLWQPLSERLRKQRLDPLTQHLKGVRRLIVLPSTALAGVPVEVIAPDYAVSYAPSGTIYTHLRQLPPPTGKGLLALGDPVFDTPAALGQAQPLPPRGVLLTMVMPGSNAAKSGLRPNDVLLRYGDTDLVGPADFKPLPESNESDKYVPVIVWREGAKVTRPLFVRPGKLGVVVAQESAPKVLAELRRLDRLLSHRSGDEAYWARLPGTRFEAESLQRLFGKDSTLLLLDSDASEQRLNELAQSGELSKYRYILLATSGEANDVFPLRSAVILARDQLPDDRQRTDLLLSGKPIPDGRLEAEEILQRWKLDCDLVTLSACQTALGRLEQGEGFVGFSQALILAGSRSVCLSLWKVHDTATALLMTRFYENLLGKREGLKSPLSKADALAEAKLWLRGLRREEAVRRASQLSNGGHRGKAKQQPLPPSLQVPEDAKQGGDGPFPFAHPYYWAAFILIGDPG